VVGQGVTDILGPGGINPYGNQFQSIFQMGGGGKGKGGQAGQDAATTAPPLPTAGGGTAAPNDALTMGLGMFFKQYLAPLMQQQQQANSALIGQYGTAMNQAMNNPLPPGIKGILSATTPQTQGTMQMLNQAGEQQALGAAPFEQFMQQIGQQSAAQQALTDMFSKWAGSVALYGGAAPQAGAALAQQFPSGSLGANLSQVIASMSSGGLTPGMGNVGGVPTGAQAGQQIGTPPAAQAQAGQPATQTATQTSQSPVTAQTVTQLQQLSAAQQKQYWDSLTSGQQAAFEALGYKPTAGE
jgi:hypothetical protein